VLDPVAVGLKFGFLAILYLFLLWTARSALKDLRRSTVAPDPDEATGFHDAAVGITPERHLAAPRLRVEKAAGLRSGAAYDLSEGAVLGRSDQADIRLEDSFASGSHARLSPHGEVVVVEDLGSTNGTYLNGEPLEGPQPLHPGDRIRIGDSEFSFER
jgi:hypothetical protein